MQVVVLISTRDRKFVVKIIVHSLPPVLLKAHMMVVMVVLVFFEELLQYFFVLWQLHASHVLFDYLC